MNIVKHSSKRFFLTKKILLVTLFALLLMLQCAPLSVGIGQCRPNVLLVAWLVFVVRRQEEPPMLLTWLVGLAIDVFQGAALGYYGWIACLASYGCWRITQCHHEVTIIDTAKVAVILLTAQLTAAVLFRSTGSILWVLMQVIACLVSAFLLRLVVDRSQ